MMSPLGVKILTAKRLRAIDASQGMRGAVRDLTLYINWLVTRSPLARD